MSTQTANDIFSTAAYGTSDDLELIKITTKAIDFADEYGNSLLHYASAHGNTEAALALIGLGASIDWTNALGWTPMMQACRYGHIDVVRLLNRHNADLKKKTIFGVTCIALAISGGHLEVVELLASFGCDIDTVDENTGFSPCLIGAHRSNLPCLRYLAARTTHFDSTSCASTARISLLEAALLGEDNEKALDACRLLLAMGASSDTRNLGATPAEVALTMGRLELAELLRQPLRGKASVSKIKSDVKVTYKNIRTDSESMDLLETVKSGHHLLLRELLNRDRRRVIEWLSEDGATPLIYAAMFGHVECCRLLIEAGCPVNTQDEVNGWTAVMQAVYHNHIDVVRLLIFHRANLDLRSKNDLTVVDIALLCEGEDSKQVLELLSPEKAIRKEHRRLQRRLKGLGLSEKDKGRSVSYTRTGSFWGLMTRRINHLSAIDEESGHGTSRLSSTVCKLTLPFRRVRRHDSKKVRFHDPKTADDEETVKGRGHTVRENDNYDENELLPRPPRFIPPETRIEKTVEGIRAIRDTLRLEQSCSLPFFEDSTISEEISWREDTLSNLLQHADCSHLAPIFAEHELDLDTVICLSESDLHEMGIDQPSEVSSLIGAIKAHRRLSVS